MWVMTRVLPGAPSEWILPADSRENPTMKKTFTLRTLLAVVAGPALAEDAGCAAADKLGWTLSVQCWTFHHVTFHQAGAELAAEEIK